jgi:hypothetical protein
MKTDKEIRIEAARLEQLTRRWIATAVGAAPSTTLAALPDSQIGNGQRVRSRLLRVEVACVADEAEFLLVEHEAGGIEPNGDSETPLILTRSDSAYEVLRDGYDAIEQERLAEFLTPIANRNEAEGPLQEAGPDLIEEIESFVEADQLSPSARLRTRADIVEFLEGRLSPSEFISATVGRQGPQPQNQELMVACLNERISATEPEENS